MQMTKAGSDLANTVLKRWVGQKCDEILHRENDWSFRFDNAGGLSVGSPWRIIASGRIAHADEDDVQQFGLPTPVNGVERTMGFLSGKRIVSVEVSPVSGDLRILFDGKTILETFTNSSGYESWHAVANGAGKCAHVVAQGGGQIAMWEG